MKPIRALLVLLALPLVSPLVGSEPPAGAPSPVLVQNKTDEFMSKFRQAMKVGATEEMNRLIRTYQDQAVYKIIEICEAISNESNEKLEEDISALTKAWKAIHKTSFPDTMYEFFSLMRPEVKEHRRKLATQYRLRNKEFVAAEAAKDKTKFGALGTEMKALGESFEKIGDYYYASQAYLLWGKSFDEFLRGNDADLKQAHDAFKKSVQLREKIGLKDILYSTTKERWMHLEKTGHGDPEKLDPEALDPVDKIEAGSSLATSFELVEDITAYRRPIYAGDELYAMWGTLAMTAKGSTTKFASIEKSPQIIRSGSSKVVVDLDHDGEGDIDIPLTGNITPIQVTLGSGDEARPWAFLTAVGAQRDTYNGMQFNLGPSDENLSVYIAPASSLVTMIGETPIRILDDNMDAKYGSDPIPWGHIGLVENHFQMDMDSVVVGSSKVAVPWSEFLQVGDTWYKVESDESGQEITAAPVPGLKTGTVKLSMKGLKADWLVIKGASKSKFENCYFDLMASKGGVKVPAGRYELFLGQVSKGKKAQMSKALVVPTDDTEVWTIEADKTTTINLGGPFKYDFYAEQDEEQVTVIGTSINVRGVANESYQRLWNCVARPDVSIRQEGKKRGTKGEGMKRADTQQEVTDNGFKYAWFPFDMSLNKKSGDNFEAQLFEKKNKLFGKIESDWR
ncbi:MAG: hypothetical protein AAF682_27780 [Planctomycetota bacterium]